MSENKKEKEQVETKVTFEYSWPKVLFQLYIHAFFLYSLVFLFRAKLVTLVFTLLLTVIGLLGTTAGAHRLWAHQSYKATKVLKLFLMLCHTLGGSGPIYDWVLDHRIHHKYHGTNDDPYNYKKGFFYAHFNQKLTSKTPRRDELVKETDVTDLENDKIVMFQKRFYWILMSIISLLLPINTPIEYWDEDMLTSFMIVGFLRLSVQLHLISLVNSARSVWGLEPNDRFFSDSNLLFLITKSHWHEYHYQVPWDCLTGEFGYYNRGSTTAFLKIFLTLGLASELKTVNSKDVTLALEKYIDTGKPIENCLAEVREDEELNHYEDNNLGVFQSIPYKST